MKIETSFRNISGVTLDRCAVSVLRTPLPFDGNDCESFIFRGTTKGLMLDACLPGWVKGIYRLNDGTVFAPGEDGIHIGKCPSGTKSTWTFYETPFSPGGIWGLSSDFVLAWGDVYNKGPSDKKHKFDGRCLVWNGDGKWRDFKSPGFGVMQIRGLAADFLYAVGVEGLVARWDGQSWKKVQVPDAGFMSDLWIVNADEMYAVSEEGAIFEGSQYGWSYVTSVDDSLDAVTKFGRSLFVSSNSLGIHKVVGRRLVPVAPKVKAIRFDARGQLIAATEKRVVTSADGKTFTKSIRLSTVLPSLPPSP